MAIIAKKLKLSNTENTLKQDSEFPTDWDIESYRTEYESQEHWDLRRRFMQEHKDKFPEDKLVCLAQVFVNMEFMGCKYPSETMLLVAELSKDIAKEFRAQRSKRLKRTFVDGSVAAEERAKALGKQKAIEDKKCNSDGALNSNLFCNLKFGTFVLFFTNGRNCLRYSADRCGLSYDEKVTVLNPGAKHQCEIYIDNKFIYRSTEDNMKVAKLVAFKQALTILQSRCYTIKPNDRFNAIKIDKANNQVVCEISVQQNNAIEINKIDSNNKGYKMLKNMGWEGGGLGLNTQGREEPVVYLLKHSKRAGLGVVPTLNREYFTSMLQNYVESDDTRDLHFEPSFTKNERAILHEIAGILNLKSISHGNGQARQLKICKKFSNEVILREILIHKNNKYADKYFVQVPEEKRRLYPDYTAKLELDGFTE